MRLEPKKLKKTKKDLIEVPNLCKNLGKNKTIHPAMFVLSNGNTIEGAKIVHDKTEQKSWLNIDASFNYSKTYQLRCSKNKLIAPFKNIKRGDVIVFRYPMDPNSKICLNGGFIGLTSTYYIKRVIC